MLVSHWAGLSLYSIRSLAYLFHQKGRNQIASEQSDIVKWVVIEVSLPETQLFLKYMLSQQLQASVMLHGKESTITEMLFKRGIKSKWTPVFKEAEVQLDSLTFRCCCFFFFILQHRWPEEQNLFKCVKTTFKDCVTGLDNLFYGDAIPVCCSRCLCLCIKLTSEVECNS